MISHHVSRLLGRASLVAAIVACCSFSFAGTIEYTGPDDGPDGPGGMSGWAGTNVWYAGVSESNTEGTGGDDGMTAELFGAPTGVSGNSIDFNPTNFQASSQGGGADITDGQLNFMVVALGNTIIDTLTLSERGDTTLAGVPSTDATLTVVTTNVFIDVVEIDGVAVGGGVNIPTKQLVFTPSDGDYFLNTDSGGGFFYSTDWDGTLSVDINDELTQLGVDFVQGATKINVAIDNTLTAVSIDGTSAFIKKKDFDGVTVITEIPEPTAAGLLLAGLAAAGCLRRR